MSEGRDPRAPEPFRPEGTGPEQPADSSGNRFAPAEGTPAPPPKRSSAQIRADMDRQRKELGQSVDHLRDKVTEITDWRGQIKKHRRPIVVGAIATGFVVGGLMALRRR